jgi:hypothetical protein
VLIVIAPILAMRKLSAAVRIEISAVH